MNATIFNVQKFCLHDGPGIRTTVFFKGCPLRCKWCHNPESQHKKAELMYYGSKCSGCGKCLGICDARSRDPSDPGQLLVNTKKCKACGKCKSVCFFDANTICGEEIDTEELFNIVLQDEIFYGKDGGMTLSGGEPSMQSEASLALIEKAKAKGISTVIETCGFGNREFFAKAGELGVTFYYDLKAIDDQKHQSLTGVSNKVILDNLLFLMEKGCPIVLRLPLIPEMNDSDEDLKLLGEFLNKHSDSYIRAEIMAYHNLGASKAQALFTEYNAPENNANNSDKEHWLDILKSYGAKNIILSE